MRSLEIDGWKLLIPPHLSDGEARRVFHIVSHNEFTVKQTLKDDQRSLVRRVDIGGLDLVLKVPVEKNNSRWIQTATLYRPGEAFKNLTAMNLFMQKELLASEPILAAEFRRAGKVVESWLLYKFIDGESCLGKTEVYSEVVTALKTIHDQGLLHGDPQIRNFIHTQGKVFSIDMNPSPPMFGEFDRSFEYVYLERSAPGIESHFGDIARSAMYRMAHAYDVNTMKMNALRKRVLGRLGLR